MGWSGENFTLDFNWANERDAGKRILAADHDTQDETFRLGIETALRKDGGNTVTGDLPFGGFQINNLGSASNATDAPNWRQVQDFAANYAVADGSTVQGKMAVALNPVVTAVSTGQLVLVEASTASAAKTLMAINNLTTTELVLLDGSTVSTGQIVPGRPYLSMFDGTRHVMLSPSHQRHSYPGFTDLYVSIREMYPSTSIAPGSEDALEFVAGRPEVRARAFDPDAAEAMVYEWVPPKGADITAGMRVRFYFLSTTGAGGGVVWNATGISIGDEETIAQAWAAGGAVTKDNSGTPNQLLISDAASVTLSVSPVDPEMIFWQFSRDATDGSDTSAVDAWLLGVRLSYKQTASNDD